MRRRVLALLLVIGLVLAALPGAAMADRGAVFVLSDPACPPGVLEDNAITSGESIYVAVKRWGTEEAASLRWSLVNDGGLVRDESGPYSLELFTAVGCDGWDYFLGGSELLSWENLSRFSVNGNSTGQTFTIKVFTLTDKGPKNIGSDSFSVRQ